MDETLELLVEFVKTASPVIWEAAYRQVYIKILNGCLGLVFLLIIYIGVLKFAKWIEEDDSEDATILRYFGTFLYTGISLVIIAGIVNSLLNPDYYAIKILLGLVRIGE